MYLAKSINFGYYSRLIDNNQGQPIIFSSYFQDQMVWKKTYNHDSIFINDLVEIQNNLGVKFPFKEKELKKLSGGVQSNIWGSLKSDMVFLINTLKFNIVSQEYKFFIKRELPFLAPIVINSHLLSDVSVFELELPHDLLEYVRSGKAKIFFSQHAEGFINSFKEMQWFDDFATHFKLPKGGVIVSSANANINDLKTAFEKSHGKVGYVTVYDSTFENRPWFWQIDKITPEERSQHYHQMHKTLAVRRQGTYSHHLLCMNRRLSEVRAIVFYYIASDSFLLEKAKISLGNPYQLERQDLNEMIYEVEELSFKDQIIDFIKDFDLEKGYILDAEDLNSFNHAQTINFSLHNSTWVSVVLESYQLLDTEIFFSEKTFRPIYVLQPFVILGNPGSLKKLKEMGYKTFSNWWDESYDENVPLGIRLERLKNTIYQIAAYGKEGFQELHFEMENVLLHNFNNLMSLERITSYEDFLFEQQQSLRISKFG